MEGDSSVFRRLPAAIPIVLAAFCAFAADPPRTEISNGQVRARLYLPDVKDGFYRSTRFDWSGVIYSLVYEDHDYYGPWFQKVDPSVRDFAHRDGEIVVGAVSAMTGPADEFQKPLGYDTAAAGATFVKVGVGVLRKPDETAYAAMKRFELVDPGKWKVERRPDSVEFTQDLIDAASGYGYVYTKTVRLSAGKAEMVISHRLRNTGRQAIRTNVYNHNFLVLDKLPPGPYYTITVPFEVKTSRPPGPDSAGIRGNRIEYKKVLEGQERVAFPIEGFGLDAKDYDFRIENSKAGVGMRITGDRPMSRIALWSIRTTMAVEPFVDVSADPGKEFTWSYTYTYYKLPKFNAP